MGELLISANGGGGVSDDITAVRNDVLKGKTAVTHDSDDEITEGTLELTGSAASGNVEAGKTFYSTDAHARQNGALRNASKDTPVKHAANNTTPVVRGDAAYVSVNTDGVTRAQIRFNEPRGVLESNTLIGVPQGTMAKAGGLSEGKLLKGQSAFGLTGTATGDATSGAGDILNGKTAYVNGSKVTGTMPNQRAKSASLNAGGSYTIPAGYHNGKGKITANNLASQTGGTSGAGDILSGKTAWVNGSRVVGTMATRTSGTTANSFSLEKDGTETIPGGGLSIKYALKVNIPNGAYLDSNPYVLLKNVFERKAAILSGSNASQTVTASSGKILYRVDAVAETMEGGNYTPSYAPQTINCKDKMMTSNIVINGMSDNGRIIKLIKSISTRGTTDLLYEPQVGFEFLIFYTTSIVQNLNSSIPSDANFTMTVPKGISGSSFRAYARGGYFTVIIKPYELTAMVQVTADWTLTDTAGDEIIVEPHLYLYGYVT